MNILVIGNGGREDAICKKIAESEKIENLYCSSGNGGTLRYAINVELKNNEEIIDFCKNKNINLVIVGPEGPLCEGLVDVLEKENILAFGANKKSAMLEGSKDFAKKFMQKYDLPTAKYKSVYSKEEAIKEIESFTYPVVVKADGLCAGKGVKICNNQVEAYNYFIQLFDENIFGESGKKAVIEEFLKGKEASLLCLVSKNKIYALESAKDYKRIFDNDEGENTGGVGCYSPSELFNENLNKEINKVLNKIEIGLEKENLEYNGILFIGFMIDNNEPKILEFNVRFGDPETEVVLPRLESDLVDIILKTINNSISYDDLKWKKEKSLTVILTAKGYPFEYEKGKEITGIANVDEDIYVYHNNTKIVEGKILSNGGRVLSITGLGNSYDEIREKVYRNIEKINFEGKQFRKDIGIIK